ncbi:hypothetical protein N3K63_12670 [Microbacterium sp. W1N]|uniref:hypothetical protein n=1 Tax=Microbacterium festucae TaxID=2977531 RepID=UPI0021BF2ACD|nr:hypothetical protein [Microbacterium festucae]MCT9821132.1 hypothetical protein [Microbacterium festucae]
MAHVEAYDISEDRIQLGSGVSVPSAWHVRVAGEQDVPGTITVRVEWDATLGRTAIAFAGVERAEGGIDITSQILREVRTHWILASSALDVVTVDEGAGRTTGAREFLGEQLARKERTTEDAVDDAVAVYRVASALSFPPLKLVSDTLQISQSTATRLMSRARELGIAPEIRMQEPRRAPAIDPYGHDPSRAYPAPTSPTGPSVEI